MGMFYSRVETMINPKDPDYGYIAAEKFGYKSSLIRDDHDRSLLMEIFCPILIEKGEAKIDRMNIMNRMPGHIEKKLSIPEPPQFDYPLK